MDRQTLQAQLIVLHQCCRLVAVCDRTASTRALTVPGLPSACPDASTPPTSAYDIYCTVAPCTGCSSPCSIRYSTLHALLHPTVQGTSLYHILQGMSLHYELRGTLLYPVPQGMSFHHALQGMSLYHALLS